MLSLQFLKYFFFNLKWIIMVSIVTWKHYRQSHRQNRERCNACSGRQFRSPRRDARDSCPTSWGGRGRFRTNSSPPKFFPFFIHHYFPLFSSIFFPFQTLTWISKASLMVGSRKWLSMSHSNRIEAVPVSRWVNFAVKFDRFGILFLK